MRFFMPLQQKKTEIHYHYKNALALKMPKLIQPALHDNRPVDRLFLEVWQSLCISRNAKMGCFILLIWCWHLLVARRSTT